MGALSLLSLSLSQLSGLCLSIFIVYVRLPTMLSPIRIILLPILTGNNSSLST